MKDRITEFFKKKNSEDSQINIDEIIKENKKLKESLGEQALEKFKTRRSIRKYSSQKVPWTTIYKIIDAGSNAPCAGNIQNYKIIVIQEKNKINEIARIASQQFWIADAPVILAVARDPSHVCEIYPGAGPTYCIQNSAAMIENMLMMAHFYELGACWVEAYENEVLGEFLNVPPHMIIDAIIPIGYPLENPKIKKMPLVSCIFFESYGNRARK